MLKKWTALLATTALLAACGESQNSQVDITAQQNGVIGGDKVSAGTAIAQHTVGLYDSKSGSLCSGTLISESLVLTAAHCVVSDASYIKVYFSPDMRETPEELTRQATAALPNKLYNPEGSEDINDVAVIRFAGPLPAGFAPAPLLQDFSRIQKGSKVIVAGYGLNWSWGIKMGSGVLRTTELKVKQSLYGASEIMLDQSVRRGICSGDSGGPAYVEINGQLHLLGVASRGDSLPIPLTPDCFILSVFTRVDAQMSWIQAASTQLMSVK
ncbi:trypsin-like serine protease [Bdellovibrio sp. 22V]|uniref:S1 family peptidase n=1 Tax=Bdellovibrio sp. 22V TaxID=3044166 RepID=UPI00254329C5|nr:trypsin-like serine protease [Bdellovibrio sp. 22V]WII73690.1 trypsin-like serine protease [Bdellovibrio sp. 22V]